MTDHKPANNNPLAGARYFFQGLSMLTKPGIRTFVFVPLLVNLLLFTAATALAVYYLSGLVEIAMGWLPGWLAFVETFLWLFIALVILLVMYFTFAIVANLIASPFNGLLAEQVEYLKTGENMPQGSFKQVLASFPASLSRELVKIIWYLPWFLILTLSMVIPVVNTVSGLLWFLFTAWVMAVQYTDYCSDNHQQSFSALKEDLKQYRFSAMGFGAVVSLLNLLPILNLLVMPAAVCGGTLLYLDNQAESS